MQQHNSEKAKERNKTILGLLIGTNLILIILTAITSATHIRIPSSSPNDLSTNVGMTAMLVGVLSVGFFFRTYSKRCPSCHALWAEVEDVANKQELSRKKGYRMQTDTNDIKNSSGEVIGKTENSYQVRVRVATHRHYYHCVVCNHVWTKDKQTEDDEFDDDD